MDEWLGGGGEDAAHCSSRSDAKETRCVATDRAGTSETHEHITGAVVRCAYAAARRTRGRLRLGVVESLDSTRIDRRCGRAAAIARRRLGRNISNLREGKREIMIVSFCPIYVECIICDLFIVYD